MKILLCCAVPWLLFTGSAAAASQGQARKAVHQGLKWLVSQQHRNGYWVSQGNCYPVSMTSLAGMALLMEGSTVRTGRYSKAIRAAVQWLLRQSYRRGRYDGLIIASDRYDTRHRYMFGHSYAMLFLACAYGEETDRFYRARMHDVLQRAVCFSAAAQTRFGGWGYVAPWEGSDFDETATTLTQLQALRAAQSAGIPVPKATLEAGRHYLQKATSFGGVLYYSLRKRQERPELGAAAMVCAFSPREYDSPLVKKWLKQCKKPFPPLTTPFPSQKEFLHYYLAQMAFSLGETGAENLLGKDPPLQQVQWSHYRNKVLKAILPRQFRTGSWSGSPGPVYATAVYLSILQLDQRVLPFYAQRKKP